VRSQQADQDGRDDEHVDDVEAGDDHAAAREVTPEQEEGQVTTHHRYRLDNGEGDPDTGTRHQVVRKRVPQEAVENAQDEHEHADDPVELTGLAERTGKEHPGHVHGDGAEEDVGGPVMGLAHQKAGADVEREVDGRTVGLRDALAPQWHITPVVHDLVSRGHVVQGQEDPGAQQNDEGVEGDLPQHERPVVGEDLVEERTAALSRAQSVIEPVEGLVNHGRSQNPGPTAWSKLPFARI